MIRFLAALALACALASPAVAGTGCPQHFYFGTPPEPAKPILGAIELCKSAYAVLWSPDTREPAYAAEHLTRDGLEKARHVARTGSFHIEPGVPRGLRVTGDDYDAGYDKGHMAPEHDMPDAAAAHESFSYANAVPQSPANNRGAWAHIEALTRALVIASPGGEGWVVTGPIFAPDPKTTGETHIPVPDRLFKGIFIPGDAAAGIAPVAGAWVVRNAADPETQFVSLDALKAETGLDPFPGLSADLRATPALPAAARKRTRVGEAGR